MTGQRSNRQANRPRLETLEGRLLLATFYVAAAVDPLEDGSAAHPFDSVQQALDAAAEGDTVQVDPGTYAGDLRITTKDLTLISSAGRDATTLQFVDDAGLMISANNVHVGGENVGGFAFLGSSGTTSLILLADGISRARIASSRLDTTGAAAVGIDAGLSPANLEISGNVFIATGDDVSIRGQDVLGAGIRLNRFTSSGASPGGRAVELVGAGAGSDIVGNLVEGYDVGIALYNGEDLFVTVQGNYLLACGVGLYFGQRGDGGGVYSAGVYGNYFLGGGTGLIVDSGQDVIASSIHVYQGNSFWRNVVAIVNRNDLTLAAGPRVGNSVLTTGTANWFGHRSGPKTASNPRGRGEAVIGSVDFYNRNWLGAPPAMPLPNATALFGVSASPSPAIPGDTVIVPVLFTNNNAFAVSGQMVLDLYVSADTTLDASDAHWQQVSFTMSLAAGQTITQQMPLVVDAGYTPGTRYILAVANAGTLLAQRVANNQPLEVAWRFGDYGKRHNAILNLGPVRYSMHGGYGTVAATSTAGVVDVDLQNTTRRSSVTIVETVAGAGWDIRNITSSTPVGSLSATRTSVLGDVTFSGGISKLSVEAVFGDSQHALDINASKGMRYVKLSLGAVNDLTLDSELPIRTLAVANWLATAGQGRLNKIVAPSIGALTSAGDFSADIGSPNQTVVLGRATVGQSSADAGPGGLRNAAWYLSGSVSSLILDKAYGSTIFVDVAPGVVGLPTTGSDFTAGGKIGKLIIGSLTDTRLAAAAMGQVQISRGPTVPGETAGLATRSLRKFSYMNNAGRINLSKLNWPGQSYQDGDFIVRIV